MYKFIFLYGYSLYDVPKVKDPIDAGYSILVLALLFHMVLILPLVEIISGISPFKYFYNEALGKYSFIPVAAILLIVISQIFNKKWRNRMVNESALPRIEMLSIQNTIMFIVLTILPLILGVYLTNFLRFG